MPTHTTRLVRRVKSACLESVAGGTDDSTQRFDDGSSLETFDDGSTLATGDDGSTSASPATSFDVSEPSTSFEPPTSFEPAPEPEPAASPAFPDADSFGSSSDAANMSPFGVPLPSDDALRAAASHVTPHLQREGDPRGYMYTANAEPVDPALVRDGRIAGGPHRGATAFAPAEMAEMPGYFRTTVDSVTGESYRQLRPMHDLVSAARVDLGADGYHALPGQYHPGAIERRIVGGAAAGVVGYELGSLALPYAQDAVSALEQNGYTGTAAAMREAGNVLGDFATGAAPVATAVETFLQAQGLTGRAAAYPAIAADAAVRLFPLTGVIYNPMSLALGVGNVAVGAAGRHLSFGGSDAPATGTFTGPDGGMLVP